MYKVIILCLALFLSIPAAAQEKGAKEKNKTEKSTKGKAKKKKSKTTDNKKRRSADSKKSKSKDTVTLQKVPKPLGESMSASVDWNIIVHDDNGNSELPARFRTWWYVKLEGVRNDVTTKINVIGDGFQGQTIVLPVYSYDQKRWTRFRPGELERGREAGGLHDYTINKQFDSSGTVYVARYFPYTWSRLTDFIKEIKNNKYVKAEEIGKTAGGRPIQMITITDPGIPDKNKRRVWIHSRTHPSETGSSFLVEGLVRMLISDCNLACKKADLSKLIFNIVPMVNIDGVVEGLARVTPGTSLDLERQWIKDEKDFSKLTPEAPPEVRAMHKTITRLSSSGPKFFAALNIHSKNAWPEWRSFIYTNFYRKQTSDKPNKRYGAHGDTMFLRHLLFAKCLSDAFVCDSFHVRPSAKHNISIDEKNFPEAWWWANYKSEVMAATLETTSGINGCYEEWIIDRDHMKLGEAIGEAVQQYYKYFIEKKWDRYEAPCKDYEELIQFYKVE